MPVFEYTALDKKGKRQKGIIDAESPIAARKKLRGSEIFPVDIKETSSKSKTLSSDQVSISTLFRRVKPGEISVMTRQLSILLNAGVPLISSLEAIISQVNNPHQKKIMAQIKESVNEGNNLASALAQHPKLFSPVYINMVRAGEASGTLDVVLERLAEFSENQEALKGKFRAALAYPVLMSIIGIGVLFVLLTFVVPNITQIFGEMEQALPLPTLILITTSSILQSFWWLMVIILILCFLAGRQFKKTPKGHLLWDELKIRIPIIGRINQKITIARFGRTLSSLLQGGVPLLTSLQIVRNIVNNVLIAHVIDDAVDDIQSGKALAATLSKSRWVPPIVIQMIAVGEQSGELEKMLQKVAESYETETESQIMALTSMLEPIMLLIMGAIVGFGVIAILLPIFEMSQMIR